MRKLVYIGEFPPPYGGVTTKNLNIKKYIFYDMDVSYLDLQQCKRNFLYIIYAVLRLILAVVLKQQIFIGMGVQGRVNYLLAMIKLFGGKKALGRTSVIVMASTMPEYCEQNPVFVTLLQSCGKVYFELETMFEEMAPYKLENYALLPNCRNGADAVPPHELHSPIRLLFFSRIHPQKGVGVLFDMMDELDKKKIPYIMDFYGPIDSAFAEEFQQGLEAHEHASYKGVLAADKENLYAKMNEYDIFLLPTTWFGESCCGAIVESKFAGIPAVVSDWHYNSELVSNGEGVVVEDNTGVCFAGVIEKIYRGEFSYEVLAEAAYKSRIKYMFEEYRKEFNVS